MIKKENEEINEQSVFDLPEMEEEKKKVEPVKKRIKQVIGCVTNTSKLRVREEPDTEADTLLLIDNGEPVTIDEAGSTDVFYKVIVKGVVGYCMKEFITIK